MKQGNYTVQDRQSYTKPKVLGIRHNIRHWKMVEGQNTVEETHMQINYFTTW